MNGWNWISGENAFCQFGHVVEQEVERAVALRIGRLARPRLKPALPLHAS